MPCPVDNVHCDIWLSALQSRFSFISGCKPVFPISPVFFSATEPLLLSALNHFLSASSKSSKAVSSFNESIYGAPWCRVIFSTTGCSRRISCLSRIQAVRPPTYGGATSICDGIFNCPPPPALALFAISISNIDCRYIDTFERYQYRYGHFWKYRYR